ncbi:glutaminyl-peptide cyclotransferase-like protein [Phanerochaete sordida]|uniref:Peptide hydrolase n=1 Tax=Phanerochaete sordida TaxID=48140 RepID=A0A9P3GCU6_9APHY|nr:glutaminyl-peptide cyclotransferase-like protein [Phanerochaete sordida]
MSGRRLARGLTLSVLLVCLVVLSFSEVAWSASRLGKRDLEPLSADAIAEIVAHPDPLQSIDPSNPSSHLSKILIPRPPDTENNTIVREYIVSTLKNLNWHVEEDSFTDSTPYGVKRFTNVIATKDPAASRRVILSAHFDSKFFSSYPESQFVGATDSAAPCAFMLDVAEALNPLLEDRLAKLRDSDDDDDEEEMSDTTLQLVFFDGEEAFKDWTATDSIYGARHLAEKWASTYITPQTHTKRRFSPWSQDTEMSSIEHLILLDLLGAQHPVIHSTFMETAWLFDAMQSAENRLMSNGAFDFQGENNARSFFAPRTQQNFYGRVEDDHIPFLRRGVDVLHVIATPFPRVWHTLADDASALDIPTMRRWVLILRVFMCEYLALKPDGDRRRAHIQKAVDDL